MTENEKQVNEVWNIIRLLEDREWADTLPKTEVGKRLHTCIEALHNEIPVSAEKILPPTKYNPDLVPETRFD